MAEHIPVLYRESLDGMALKPDGIYVDGTFGRGGHSGGVLEQLGVEGRLIAFDRDPAAQATAQERFGNDPRFQLFPEPFSAMRECLGGLGLMGKIDAVLLDLGVSSPQLDDPGRGFSFMQDGPLDMRMDTTRGVSAAEWLAHVDEAELAQVMKELGEERFAKRIARALVAARNEAPITTTGQLAKLVSDANPSWEQGKHPATRAFLAFRLYVNRELDEVSAVLPQAVDALKPGGRLAVISFHSLEDRIVKRFIRDQARGKQLPKGLPVMDVDTGRTLKGLGKAIKPSAEECDSNPRARSAILRLAERL